MEIISRNQWGARYASAYQNLNAPLPAQQVWLHHSVTIAPNVVPPFDDDYAAIRAIEQIGQDRFGWGISYTFLITPSGLVFEGHRVNGVGTHTANRNSTARGICLVGNYDLYAMTASQEYSLAALLSHGYMQGWWDEPKLDGGHRDLSSTACPGQMAYNRISIVNETARSLFMADSPMIQDIAWRVHSFLQSSTKKLGGPTTENHPMTSHLLALVWRVEALVNGRTTVMDGPTKDEPVYLVKSLNEINSKLDALQAELAGWAPGSE